MSDPELISNKRNTFLKVTNRTNLSTTSQNVEKCAIDFKKPLKQMWQNA